ncbi:MAG: PKD domain-containing protein [Putridiphycobacter sp.]
MKWIKIFMLLFLGQNLVANAQCNTNITICENNSLAGPFTFSPASSNPSSCLDFINGQTSADYAYIILYITQSGDLNLLIDGNSTSGCLDVSIFDITGQSDPCSSLGTGTEIGCNYASNCDGCNEFGSTFPGCLSEVPAPYVNAGDVIMILVENWDGFLFGSSSFTLQLDNGPGSAQTGPPDATITPAGPFATNDPVSNMTAANGGGTWSASCGACINSSTGAFDPTVAGVGTHQICYDIGAVPCDASDCINVTVGPVCNMTGISANQNITCPSTTYSTTGQVSFTTPPTTGTLTVSDCNGNNQVFNAPFTSPINYTINNQSADGLNCDISAVFSADPTCIIDITYTAPICPCNIDLFTTNINICDATTNTYSVFGDLEFSSPPSTGTLTVTIDNGTSTYDTIINAADFISPLTYSISGIPADGSNTIITAEFSADNTCSNSINYTAPADCSCPAEVGTFNTSLTGDSPNNFVLCFGDQFDFESNGDYTPPNDVSDPMVPYNPGIGYLIYSCPPTIGMTPDANPTTGDPCIEGLILDGAGNVLLTDINDLSLINAFPAGTFTDNIIYFVPVTMYDITGNYYSATNTGGLCYDMGTAIPVQYLPEIKSVEVEDCQAGSITSTITGGLSELDGSNYTIVTGSLTPSNASFVNTTAVHGGTITISGLTSGQAYSFDIEDANGCPITVSGTFIGTEDPGFSYDTYSVCTNAPDPIVNITGDPGSFSFVVISGGPTLSLNTTTGAIDASASNPGVYEVTYQTNDPTCFSDSTVTMTILETPTVNAVSDQTVCEGIDFNPINFSGSPLSGVTYDWTNSNTNIGLNANGTGNINGFTGQNGTTAQLSGTITVTPTLGACIGQSTSFDLIVNPQEDASFNYVNGLTYCATSTTDPVANITGTTGGSFSYSVNSGGPTLSLNSSTGDINLATSNLGNYSITYTTTGACFASSTLDLSITNSPEANFSIPDVCLNGINPSPNYTQDDNGNPFAVVGSGGSFSELNNDGNISINPTTGVVDLANSLPGTYTLVNTITLAGCSPSNAQDNFTIFDLPTATISSDQFACPDANLSQLDIQVDMQSNGPFDLSYTTPGTSPTATGINSPFIFHPTQFGDYTITSITDNNGCTNTLNGSVLIDSFPTPHVHPLNDYQACANESISVSNFEGYEAGDTFVWSSTLDLGFGTNGTAPPHIGTFTPTNTGTSTVSVYPISVNGCQGPTITFDIEVSPIPNVSFFAIDSIGCEPLQVEFINNSTETFDCVWDFGDGTTQQSCGNISHTYDAGIYDVSLTVTSANGCSDSLKKSAYIEVYPVPVSVFTFSPQITDVNHTEVIFENNSVDAINYIWDFGDESAESNEENPIHEYPDVPNEYVISLVASNSNGACLDTSYATLIVNDVLVYYVPNVFTPDNDEFNQTFQPVFTSGFDPYDYHLTIFNRWGEIIFESYNATVGWDGTYPESGELCEDGVYVWKIEFKDTKYDKRYYLNGHVTLLK